MNGNVEEVLENLGFKVKENTNTQNIINYSYSDLSKLLSTLKTGDKAYEFDMLPSYAYLDNENEKEYLESRVTAMKNGSKFLLFIVGSKNRIEELKTNDPTYLNNARSISILKNCLNKVEDVEISLKNNLPIDMIELDIKGIWEELGKINGSTYEEELLDEMFKRFCLGK